MGYRENDPMMHIYRSHTWPTIIVMKKIDAAVFMACSWSASDSQPQAKSSLFGG